MARRRRTTRQTRTPHCGLRTRGRAPRRGPRTFPTWGPAAGRTPVRPGARKAGAAAGAPVSTRVESAGLRPNAARRVRRALAVRVTSGMAMPRAIRLARDLGGEVYPRARTGELVFRHPALQPIAVHAQNGAAPRRLTVWLKRAQEAVRREAGPTR